MIKNNTTKTYNILIEAIRAAGMGLGIYLTKPALEKRLSKSLNLADTSIKKTLAHKPKLSYSPIGFELAGLGGIAAYKFYNGMKKKKRANVVEGVFLTSVLLIALAYKTSLKNKLR